MVYLIGGLTQQGPLYVCKMVDYTDTNHFHIVQHQFQCVCVYTYGAILRRIYLYIHEDIECPCQSVCAEVTALLSCTRNLAFHCPAFAAISDKEYICPKF